MRGLNSWNQTPFTRLTETHRKTLPYICAISPFEGGFRFEWFDKGSNGAHKLVIHKLETCDSPIEVAVTDNVCVVENLEKDCEYEITLHRVDMTAKSATRLVRTGGAHGITVNYLHPQDDFYKHSGKYLGSPSIVRLPSGRLVASMDFHAGGDGENLTMIFRSDDGGKNWRYLTELSPCFWGKLFVHKGKLYNMACAGVYGDIILGCSEDEGENWCVPVHIVHGVNGDYGGHHGVMPVIEHGGRLYTTFEYGGWKFMNFCHSLLSIDAEADLMKPENWIFTPPVAVDRNAPGMPVSSCTTAIEGNAVPLPDGTVGVLLRLDPTQMNYLQYNRALLVRSNPDNLEEALKFDRVIDMPCGMRNKFSVRRVPEGDVYVAFCNECTEDYYGRGILTFAYSYDCVNWKTAKRIVDSREERKLGMNAVGYSYPDFDFDGDDIVLLTRTAANKAKSQHDSNIISFFRIENYRQYIK